ncbi:MAG: 6-phosphogluconolactonase [Planctomycetes bacterium SCN 63-9]|nr:MAG: 6-phosphogluconolactonase [Planctomycetes bacterium SCN 63-9]
MLRIRSIVRPVLLLAVSVSVVGIIQASEAGSKGEANVKEKPGAFRVYVGTYTGGKAGSEGIYLLELDPATGALESKGLAGKIVSPSFLAIHPSRKFLYSVNEVGEFGGKPSGAVTAFAIDEANGSLKQLNQQATVGTGPCHLTVDATGKNLLVANYGSGSVAVLPIAEDGSLRPASSFIQHAGKGANPSRQEGPHAHSINLDAANRFAFAADLGLDKVLIYAFDAAKGTIAPNASPFAKVAPGAGPRHFAFHPGGKLAYVINEMGSTVTAFSYDPAAGSLTEIQTISTLPADFKGQNDTAEIQVHPSGKFVYGSNRGHDSIAVFAVDEKTGKLEFVEARSTEGKVPRNFAIDPTGAFLLAENQDSDTVVVFRIDPATGKLTPTGTKVSVPMPVCIKMIPAPASTSK